MHETRFVDDELQRAKARAKARLLQRPELLPLLGRFQLRKLLGRGGNGSVYEAEDTRDGGVVAVKLLLDSRAQSILRFKSEFRRLADLAHNNLVRLLELFKEGDDWYFSMELVRGVTFREHAEQSIGAAADAVRSALVQLLSAVETIHEAGYLHCDLKPSNVLVEPSGRVVVLDFGLITRDGEPSQTGRKRPGTPAYMAPELFAGAAHSRASDAYAIGVMLFEVLHGEPIAGALDLARVRAALRDTSREVPEDLRAVCEALLEPEPAARLPLRTAAARIGGSAPAQARGPERPGATLVGRADELARLLDAFDAPRDAPQAWFVSGPSGIGKTALCDVFAERVRGRGLLLRGVCHERESLPYKAFDGIIDDLVRELASVPEAARRALRPRRVRALLRVFPGLRGSFSESTRDAEPTPSNHLELLQQAFEALKELLCTLAKRCRLVLIVDDLQWADLDSARLLLELIGPPDAPAFLYVGCYRNDERDRSEFLRTLFNPDSASALQCEVEQLPLAPLAVLDAMDMARHAAPLFVAGAAPALARIARESGGNPFIILELARYFAAERDSAHTAYSLTTVLSARVAELPALEREMLWLLALAARPVSAAVLARLARDGDQAQAALRALSIAGLIRCGARGSWVVYHDRLREHLAHMLPALRRAALHRTLAESYEAAPESVEPAWLIEHWLGAGEPERACAYALQAAKVAMQKLAFNHAAELWRDVIRLCDAADPRLPQLYLDLAEALASAGRSAEAAEAFSSAAERAPAAAVTELRCRAVQQLLRSGRTTRGIELLRPLLAEVGVGYPERTMPAYAAIVGSRVRSGLRRLWPKQRSALPSKLEQQRLLVLRSVFRELSLVHPVQGAVFQSLFSEQAQKCGDLETRFVALAWDTYGLGLYQGTRASARLRVNLARLEALRAELNTPYADATVLLMRAAVALFECRCGAVDAPAREASRLFRERCAGASWEAAVADTVCYLAIEVAGPISAWSRDAFALHRRAREHGDVFTEVMTSRMRSQGLLALDRPDEALAFMRDCLARLERVAGREFEMARFTMEFSLVDCLSYQQRNAEAWEVFEREWPRYTQSVLFGAQHIHYVTHYRRARLAAALFVETRDRSLARVVESSIREQSRSVRADAQASTYWLRAALESHHGKAERVCALLERSEEICRAGHVLIPAAMMRRHRGRVAGGTEGARLVDDADAALRGFGICNPELWARTFTAGVISP